MDRRRNQLREVSLTRKGITDTIEQLVGMDYKKYGVNDFKEKLKIFEELMISVPYKFPFIDHPDYVIQRGRLTSKHRGLVNNTKRLKCRPAKETEINRANDEGKPVFYGALNLTTIFSELGASKGSIIQVIHIRPKNKDEELVFSVIGQIDQRWKYGFSLMYFSEDYDDNMNKKLDEYTLIDQLKISLIDAFFAAQFRKRVKRAYEYKLCAAICELYMEAQNTDGVIYPSVENLGGLNVAIKESSYKEKCETTFCSAWEIADYLGYGKYFWKQYAEAKREDIDNDGNIAWTYLDPDFQSKTERKE